MSTTTKRTVTLALIRKRSEHNEGLVSTLEELALHQEELQCIGPTLGRTCGKTLKLLLLQNNVIERMDPADMKYFKVLEYLNLALNNVTVVEGLSGMECLKKLDLTLNFIPIWNLERSVDELAGCPNLEELFFIGNPCMGAGDSSDSSKFCNHKDSDRAMPNSTQRTVGWSGCRSYIIARLSHLKYLDGKEVKRSERILAVQELPTLVDELRNVSRACHEDQQSKKDGNDDSVEELRAINNDAPTHHDPSTRTQISNEMYAQKQSKEKQQAAHLVSLKGENDWEEEHKATVQKVREREGHTKLGNNEIVAHSEIKQCNQGKWNFWFEESEISHGKDGILTMTVDLPKHLSTSLIDADIHPTYVSVIVKSKVLRVILPVEVASDRSVAKRIASSGHLELIMPKTNPNQVAISMTHARKSKLGQQSSIGGKYDDRSQTHKPLGSRIKREGLGDALLQEALTFESLRGMVDMPNNVSRDSDEDEPPPLL